MDKGKVNSAVLVKECLESALNYRELIEGHQRKEAYIKQVKRIQIEEEEAARAQSDMLTIQEMEKKKIEFEKIDRALEEKEKTSVNKKSGGRLSHRLSALRQIAARSSQIG